MKLSYVLPDPGSYRDWGQFDGDLAVMRRAGYDAVELQIADPAQFDEPRVRRSLAAAGYAMCRLPDRLDLLQPGQLPLHARRAVRRHRRPARIFRRSGGTLEGPDRLRIAPGAAQRRADQPPAPPVSATPSATWANTPRSKA